MATMVLWASGHQLHAHNLWKVETDPILQLVVPQLDFVMFGTDLVPVLAEDPRTNPHLVLLQVGGTLLASPTAFHPSWPGPLTSLVPDPAALSSAPHSVVYKLCNF